MDKIGGGVGGFVVAVKVTYQMWTKLEEAFAVRVRVTYHMRTKWWGFEVTKRRGRKGGLLVKVGGGGGSGGNLVEGMADHALGLIT